MRILVTGSNGLLGQKLVELISSGNDYLIATAKSTLVINLPKGEFHSLDVTDVASVESVIAQSKPDVIIHTARPCRRRPPAPRARCLPGPWPRS